MAGVDMMRKTLSVLCAAGLIGGAGAASGCPLAKRPNGGEIEAFVWPGMSDAEVVRKICPPDFIRSNVTLTHVQEQWIYNGNVLSFENGRLVSMQLIMPGSQAVRLPTGDAQ